MNNIVYRDNDNNLLTTLNNNESINKFVMIENIRCPDHYEYPIQYFCLDCKRHCFCSECGMKNHVNCEVVNLRDGFQIVLNKFINKWISLLSSKSENLQVNFKQYLLDKKELYVLKLQYLLNNIYNINYNINNSLLFRNPGNVAYGAGNLEGVNGMDLNGDVNAHKDEKPRQTNILNYINENNQNVQVLYNNYKNYLLNILSSYESLSTMLRNQYKNNNSIQLLRYYHENHEKLNHILLTSSTFGGLDVLNDINSIDFTQKTVEDSILYNNNINILVDNLLNNVNNNIKANEGNFKYILNIINSLQENIRSCHLVETYTNGK